MTVIQTSLILVVATGNAIRVVVRKFRRCSLFSAVDRHQDETQVNLWNKVVTSAQSAAKCSYDGDWTYRTIYKTILVNYIK